MAHQRGMRRRPFIFTLVCGAALALGACAAGGGSGRFDDGSLYGNYLAGRYAAAMRDADAAGAFFLEALEADPDNSILLQRAFFLALAAGDMADALDLAARIDAGEDDVTGGTAQIALTAEALRRGRNAEARRRLSAGEYGPFNATLAALFEAWAYAGEGRYGRAVETLDAENRPDIFRGFHGLHRALILDLAGEVSKARLAYGAAETSVIGAQARAAFGVFLEREGPREDAVAQYEGILEDAPYDAGALSGLARIAEGRRPARYISDVREGAALACLNMAAALASEGGLETPLIYIQLALHLDPDLASARALKAELHETHDMWEAAAEAYARITPDATLYPASRIGLAANLERMGDSQRAIEILERLVRTDGPATLPALLQLADVLRTNERFEEAVKVYDQALARPEAQTDVAKWRIFFARGVAHERAGNWPAAEKDLQASLAISPDQAFVLNYLGYSWVDRGERLEEGMALIERAVSLRPTEGSIVDSLGWAHYRLGAYDEALIHLERAAELMPGDPTIIDHLGDAYWRTGRKIEARFEWRRALTLDPDPDMADRIRLKLDLGLDAVPPDER